MTLHAEVAVRLGSLSLDVRLDVADDVVAVVGPNGAGKTTLLRALAGLVPLDHGKVTIGDVVVEDTGGRIRYPAEHRRLGVVFQEHRLFPSMSVLDNVAFGLRATGTRKSEANRRAAAWLDQVGLSDIASLRPVALSGGQAQRVALARVLATEPGVLLLDEPLSSVDATVRTELRHLLHRELRRYPGTRLVVTHDPLEAAALADRLVVLEEGSIVQDGPLVDVTARPRTPWIASMVGLNLLQGVAKGTVVQLPSGTGIVTATACQGPAFAAFRPNAVMLHRRPPEGSARNVWPSRAVALHNAGDRVRVRVEGPVPLVAEVTAGAVAELDLAAGGEIWVSVKATDIDVYRN